MADLVTIATTAVLSQFLGPSAKHLGEQALERGKQLASKATAYLAAVGREPQPVEPKILLPLVQAASLETDPTLAEQWAALLANAADPAQRVEVQPGFAEVLRQLTPPDAQTLAILYGQAITDSTEPVTISLPTHELSLLLKLPYNETSLIVDNLLRQQLCLAIKGASGLMPAYITSTTYGFYFMRAVSPPKP